MLFSWARAPVSQFGGDSFAVVDESNDFEVVQLRPEGRAIF